MMIFKPTGSLNVSASASDLPEEGDASASISNALTRCKNMRLDRDGRADTRFGSTTVISTAMSAAANFILEQAGVIYAFVDSQIYRDGVSIVSSLTAGNWSAIKYNSFNDTTQRIFALNGTDTKKITGSTVTAWGITSPTSAPTLSAGASTGLTGSYNVKYTYAYKVGAVVVTESNPSDAASSAQSLTNQSLSVSFTASSDSQVTHVRVYRTLAGGSEYFHDQDVAIGTTTLDTTTTDANLGTEVATDHDTPPAGTVIAGPFYNGICFIAVGNLLYWCLAKQPEYWPAVNFIEVGPPQFPILAIVSLDGNIYCITKHQIWFIQGTTGGAFNPVPIEALAGCNGQHQAIGVKGHGIYHKGPDGIYLYVAGRDRKITESAYDPLFRGRTVNDMPAVSGTQWLKQYENKIYFHYGEGNVLIFNIDTGKSYYFKYDQTLTVPGMDYDTDSFIVGTADKKIRKIEDKSVDLDADSGFAWESQSKDFTLQTKKYFPSWVKYDTEGTMTGEVILDGVSHQTHAITESRNTKRRLVEGGNGSRLAIGLSGNTSTGPATVYAVEME